MENATSLEKPFIRWSFIIISISLVLRLIFMQYTQLLVEEAYYWNYSLHLDYSYLDHPPMVAWLIKLSTALIGSHELALRLPSLCCWAITAFFIFKLTELLRKGCGVYALTFLAVLPFFFLQSLVITPDEPLVACWSAAIYWLYRALVLNEKRAWLLAGLAVGLGLLSKYTIGLLAPATLLYLLIVPSARGWFARKEPYLCAMIALMLFSPVIYWNATHHWASFIFQTTRRITDPSTFSLHKFIALLLFFMMPFGLWTLWKLLKTKEPVEVSRFFQLYACVPLFVFALFSFTHPVQFDWMGPALVVLIPWEAMLLQDMIHIKQRFISKGWLLTAGLLLLSYALVEIGLISGQPMTVHQQLLQKFIDWQVLAQSFNNIASDIEQQTKTTPIFVPLDLYNLSSELSYYQNLLWQQHRIKKIYPINGAHPFGFNSLMYNYWTATENLAGKTVILMSLKTYDFNEPSLNQKLTNVSPLYTLASYSNGGALMRPYYYKIATVKG